ncbi:AAA family ATPase [Campylobacter ureolyticus]|jgi:hypothetical protein|uniref:AAA family ATPase n=1 Tax=Campylobacter ureolyticus TaxID=827 RepID=UPI0022B4458E|nr:AAA family ATPase [Campylobacter ureolyticus]MCZ6116385.1 AAA family ATPase [Campylobacter ureolyticus]
MNEIKKGIAETIPLKNFSNQLGESIAYRDFKLAEKEKELENLLKNLEVKKEHKIESDYLIPFSIKLNKITMIYAPAGVGKSFIAWGISRYAYRTQKVNEVRYLDADNGLDTIFSRKIQNLIKYANYRYINFNNPSIAQYYISPHHLLNLLKECDLSNKLIVIDSIKDFILGDVTRDQDMNLFSKLIIKLRTQGATVLMLHHTTKSGSSYKGATNLLDSVDTAYSVQPLNADTSRKDGYLQWKLKGEKKRDGGEDFELKYFIDSSDIELKLDVLGYIKEKDIELIEQIEKVIKENYMISHDQIFKILKRHKKDKKVIKILNDFVNSKWFIKTKNRRKFYYV